MSETFQPVPKPLKELQVYTQTAHQFFNSPLEPVGLPDYQRPYVWDGEKIDQLLQDWSGHFFYENKFINDAPYYYMGTLLFYEGEDHFDVVDGQQRITTLSLINQYLMKDSSYLKQGKWDLTYNSLLSSANIKNNFNYLKTCESIVLFHNYITSIFEKLVFTIIITNSEDEAFTFFDSQNNRGISLDAVDFLKSYHLRELKDNDEAQRNFVRQWDSNNASQFLGELFSQTLWRSRNWKGKHLEFENKNLILSNFQKQTYKAPSSDFVRLFPNINNRFASELIYNPKQGILIQQARLSEQLSAESYPFSLRQPIQRGVGFFLYTEKYHALYELLYIKKEMQEVTSVMETLIKSFNSHFISFYKLAVIMYYDKFKSEKILEFTLWLDFLLGSVRISQSTIVAQTPVKILTKASQNLLDVIELAYRPEDIFIFIRAMKIGDNDINTPYTKKADQYGPDKGVRNQYRIDNLKFYNDIRNQQDDDLTNKKQWIYETVR